MKRTHALNKIAAALALVAVAPFAASAQDAGSGLSYNYVQGGYTHINSDVNAKGWGVDGSVAVHPNVHLFAGYSAAKANTRILTPTGSVKPEVDQWKVGAGYNRSISAKTDFVGTLAYQKAEAKAGSIREDAEGYAAEAGVRSALAPKFEGYALAGYEDAKDFDGDFYGRVGGQVKFNQNWGVAADVKFADGDTQLFVGPRITW